MFQQMSNHPSPTPTPTPIPSSPDWKRATYRLTKKGLEWITQDEKELFVAPPEFEDENCMLIIFVAHVLDSRNSQLCRRVFRECKHRSFQRELNRRSYPHRLGDDMYDHFDKLGKLACFLGYVETITKK